MMKKYTKYTLLLLAILSFSACDLSEDPYGFYSEDNFYLTQNDAEAALYYAYDALTFIGYSRSIFVLNCIASDLYTTKEGSASIPMDTWTFDASTEHIVDYFTYAYIGINRANAVIENTPRGNFPEDFTGQVVGQAKFLRAWNYFNLVKMFGLVPLHTSQVDNLSETNVALAEDLQQVYELIISDLEDAEQMLKIDKVYGLADLVAAQALLSKVYLTMASSSESGVPLYDELSETPEELYGKAGQYAAKVLFDQTSYSFDTNLLDIYDIDRPDGPEHIFLLSMDRTGPNEGDYSKFSKMFLPWVSGSVMYLKNPDGSLTPTHDGWSEYQPENKLIRAYRSGDRRKGELIVSEVFDAGGNTIASVSDGTVQYPFTRKYIDPYYEGDKTSIKPFLLRFSDIALVYAEAMGPSNEAYEVINQIRFRAGIPELTAGLSVSDFRDSVFVERSLELAFEGHRLSDLKRKKLVKNQIPEASVLSDMEAYYYPIPQRELDLNSEL